MSGGEQSLPFHQVLETPLPEATTNETERRRTRKTMNPSALSQRKARGESTRGVDRRDGNQRGEKTGERTDLVEKGVGVGDDIVTSRDKLAPSEADRIERRTAGGRRRRGAEEVRDDGSC